MSQDYLAALGRNILQVGTRKSVPKINEGWHGQTLLWMHSDNEKNRPNPAYRDVDISYVLNSHGYREDEFDFNDERPTILCLGDSFTLGVGLPRKWIWPKLLEGMFEGVRVINLGDGGASNDQMTRTLGQAIELFKPVLVIANLSDASRREFFHPAEHTYVVHQKLLVNTGGHKEAHKKVHAAYLKMRNPVDDFINYCANTEMMKTICMAHGAAFRWSTWDHEMHELPDELMDQYTDPDCRMKHRMVGVDNARDNSHFGVESNLTFATQTFEVVKDIVSETLEQNRRLREGEDRAS